MKLIKINKTHDQFLTIALTASFTLQQNSPSKFTIMKKLPFAIIPFVLLLFLSTGCFEDSECGSKESEQPQIFTDAFFTMPSEIYWGESSGIRSPLKIYVPKRIRRYKWGYT
jgi:hypothetical protein